MKNETKTHYCGLCRVRVAVDPQTLVAPEYCAECERERQQSEMRLAQKGKTK